MTADHDDVLDPLFERTVQSPESQDPKKLSKELAEFYAAVVEEADGAFRSDERGVPCSRLLCSAVDRVVHSINHLLETNGHEVAWVAAGGYGRGYLSPCSHLNLLLLAEEDVEDEQLEALESRTRRVLEAGFPHARLRFSQPSRVPLEVKDDPLAAFDLLETRHLAGNADLHEKFRRRLMEDFFAVRWGSFCQQLMQESLDRADPYTSSPFCTEPNLKEGRGALRDIGMMQKLSPRLSSVPEVEGLCEPLSGQSGAILTEEENSRLSNAFDFILRARNQLHFLSGEGHDILDRALQPDVAEELGFEGEKPDRAQALMRKLFGHTGRTYGIMQAFRERFEHLRCTAWQKPTSRTRKAVGDKFALVEGKLYNAARPSFAPGEAAHRMMSCFALSQRHHVPISQELLDEINDNLGKVHQDKLWDRETAHSFLQLLSGSAGVARRLRWMRDSGLLQTYIPPFEELIHRVEYGESLEYTLDEHVLNAIEVVDKLSQTDHEEEVQQRELLSGLERPDLLRLGLLTHHFHSKDAVREVADRLHLDAEEKETLLFLHRNGPALTECAERHNFHDPDVLERMAERVGNAHRLDLLYIFSYADCRATGRTGWFEWLDALLYELYEMVRKALDPEFQARATEEYFRERFLELAQSANRQREAEKFNQLLPTRYKLEVEPEKALQHLRLVRETREADVPARLESTVKGSEAELWFCSTDSPARFSQIAGVLALHELNVVSARAFTLSDGIVLDCFRVHKKDRPVSTDREAWDEVEWDLARTIRGELELDAAVREAAKARRPYVPPESVPSRREVTSLYFDNDTSPLFTILGVVTWDRPGLVYELCRAMSELELNIEFAKISTRLGFAHDVFYIDDRKSADQIVSEDRLKSIRRHLTEVARPGSLTEAV